jgi:hypothetical protein
VFTDFSRINSPFLFVFLGLHYIFLSLLMNDDIFCSYCGILVNFLFWVIPHVLVFLVKYQSDEVVSDNLVKIVTLRVCKVGFLVSEGPLYSFKLWSISKLI